MNTHFQQSLRQFLIVLFLCSAGTVWSKDQLQIDLGNVASESYKKRNAASKSILKQLKANKDKCKIVLKFLSESDDPEVKIRLEKCLRSVINEAYFNPLKGYMGFYHKKSEIELGNKIIHGFLVQSVVPNLPAEKSGLQKDDLIIKFKDFTAKEKSEHSDLSKHIRGTAPGTKVDITVIRQQKEVKFELELAARTDHQPLTDAEYETQFKSWMQEELQKLKTK